MCPLSLRQKEIGENCRKLPVTLQHVLCSGLAASPRPPGSFRYSGNYTERRKGMRKSVGPADSESINIGSTKIWFPGHISFNLGIDPRCKQNNIRCSKNLTKPFKKNEVLASILCQNSLFWTLICFTIVNALYMLCCQSNTT